MKNPVLTIGNANIQPGERIILGLPTPELSTYTSMHIPIHVIHGKKEGPCLLVCATIHGDEMNGIAIIHRLLNMSLLKSLHGTLIAIPALNVYGLTTLTRNLPDHRDLDGSFPGKESGSFASRLAHHLNREILSKATHCIDIHTGTTHIKSLPQIQTNLDSPETERMARAFQPFVVLSTQSERGLLWQNAQGIPTLIYQAGEPLRLHEKSIRIGLRGILRVMRNLNMLKWKSKGAEYEPVVVRSTEWLTSPSSGLFQSQKKLGSFVKAGEVLGVIYDPFGTTKNMQVTSSHQGIIVSKNTLPLVNEGDALVQLALTEEKVHAGAWDALTE